jgi:hypothetical protein
VQGTSGYGALFLATAWDTRKATYLASATNQYSLSPTICAPIRKYTVIVWFSFKKKYLPNSTAEQAELFRITIAFAALFLNPAKAW